MPLHTRASSLTALTAGVLLAALLVSGCSSSDRSVAKGDQLFEQKDYKAALLEYRRAVSKDPKSGEARRKLARTYRALGAMDAAWREYVRAADVLPDDAEAQLDAVQALLDTGQFDDAKARAERLIGRDPRNVRAHVLRGLATAGLKDLDGAVKDVKTALELDPSRASSYVNLGAMQLALGQSAEAEAALKQGVALAPKDLAPRLALANFYWRVGRKDETEQALKEALALDPKNVDANLALSMFYVSTARPADAEAPLKTAAENPDALEIRLMLADYYVANQRLPDAAKVLEQLSSRREAHAAAEARLAGIEYVRGNHETAYGKVDALLKSDPKNVPVLILKSRWLLSEKKTDEALASAKAAVAADPKAATAHYMLARIYTAQNNAQQAMAEYNEVLAIAPGATLAQLELAQIQLATGQAEAAVQLASSAVRAQPQNPDARLTFVRSLRSRGDLTAAATELQPLLKDFPKSAPVHAEAGEIALRQKQYAQAAASFDRASSLDPDSYEALAGRVYVDLSQRKYPDAVRRVEARLAKTPSDARVLTLAGRTYAIAGDLAKSESVLRKAIETDPSSLMAYHYLGQIMVRQKRLDESLQQYQDVLKQQPNNVAAHTMVAMLLQVQNKQSDAKARYEKILQLDPRSVVASNNLAYMQAEAGTDLDRALQLAQTAKAALPDEPDVNDTLGWVYYKKDMAPLAIDPLRQSVERVPTNPLYRYHLGMAYLKAGDKDKAKEMLQLALKLDPRFDGADEARRALGSLGS